MTSTRPMLHRRGATALDLIRCLDCGHRLNEFATCCGCGRDYPLDRGILSLTVALSGRNRIAAAFYDGPNWRRFQPWEDVFLWFQGPGVERARRKVLRHLPDVPRLRALEVGIGDGANLPLLPPDWEVHGVDIAINRLRACGATYPAMIPRLVQVEAERLPYEDACFDVVWTMGGLNYFRDPEQALREMKRVVRPGGLVLAADERPDLHRFSPGHALGLEWLDAWSLQWMGIDPEFVRMVLHDPAPSSDAATRAWPRHQRHTVWNRLGYCLVDIRES